MSFIEQYLLQLNTEKRRWRRAVVILTGLSLVVALVTVWNLRMTGVTIANDASCGYEEHQHTEECTQEDVLVCTLPEHIHKASCYSDPTMDTETLLDWQNMFAGYPYTGVLREDLVGIAKTQVGYTESQMNFELGNDGVRHGYTRYGAWYGVPYNNWSAIFVSFCLSYAGADEAVFPISSSAGTMAELWKTNGKYIPIGEYVPQSGDIVFFNDNTAGIIAEVFGSTFCVIRGDMENAVTSDTISLSEASIVGWGSVETAVIQDALQPDDLLDISNGPAVFIIEGQTNSQQPARRATMRAARAASELIPYLQANGGDYFYTLLDLNNAELPKDENGNYIAEAQKEYKLTITFNSPKGFLPGTYQYQIPNGLMVEGGQGEFVLKDGTNVGSWVVTDTGLITLVFNENMNSRTDITISSTLGIRFTEQDDTIDFDGSIFVKVEPPVQQKDPTALTKWGSPKADAGKINWSVRIEGHKDSQIPGNIITDQPTLSDWSRPHSYTQSDIDGGLTFGVSDPEDGWHTWTVHADDPHLIWDETGWSYKIPKTVICDYCGELELGNEGWVYMVNYTSTPTQLHTPGTFDYENKVTVDGQTAWGWSNFTHIEIEAEIVKKGSFAADAAGGGFLWEFQATIPGRPEGQRAEYSWFIMDEMQLMDAGGAVIGRVTNDVHLSTVTAIYNGSVIQIPRIQDATDADMFAWDNAWTATENGVSYIRTINLLCRCQCTPETCHWTGCGEYWFQKDNGEWAANGFCQCWTETQNMTFTFVYKTEDLSLIRDYGALGYRVNNHAQLYYMPDGSNSIRISYDDATVTIPNLFEKQLTHDFDGYTAHYKVTVNEAKLVLTNGSPLTIHDAMTDTLAYISGSLVIAAEDSNGNTSILQQGVDFTVTYDGSGEQTDSAGKKIHVLDIVILNPQPVMYILDYDTTLIIPEHVSGGVKYSNSANITIWGKDITDNAVEKVYADINIAAKSYTVEMLKTCALTGKPLPRATFGLYNAQGGLVTTGVTDVDGKITFQTNVTDGVILQEHVLYYLQEIHPPLAYQLDDTKYWFCFCSDSTDRCIRCDNLMTDANTARIPFGQSGLIEITNHPADVVLPATGSTGKPIYILCGLILVFGPFVYGFSLRRRYGRRYKR